MTGKQAVPIVSGSMAVDTYLGNAQIQTTHSGPAGMLRAGLVIVDRADVLDLARALSMWHAYNVRDGTAPEPSPPKDEPLAPFVECDTCAARPGSPTLCADCLRRRQSWERARGAPPSEERTADVLKRLYACKLCGAENQILHFEGDRQVGCARCDQPRPLTVGRLDAAYKRLFTDAALKERDRMASFGARATPPVELDSGLDASGPMRRQPIGREVYARAVALLGDVEVIPGVELRVDEILEVMLPTVRACAQDAIGEVRLAIATLDDRRPIMVHAQRLAQLTERYITLRCPGRRYFVEVGNDAEGWIQVCTPMPVAAEPAA